MSKSYSEHHSSGGIRKITYKYGPNGQSTIFESSSSPISDNFGFDDGFPGYSLPTC